MATDTHPDFDPRFDPSFQRGFGDAVEAAPRADVTGVERPRVASRPPAPPAPTTALGTTAPREALIITASEAQAAIDSETRNPTDATADVARTRGPNPFVIALGVVSVVLVAGGVWGIQAARTPFQSGDISTVTDFVGTQLLVVLAPVALALGVATAIGIGFVYAVAWQKRNRG